MHHVQLEQYARRDSYLHALDSRAKIAAVGIFLAALGTLRGASGVAFCGLGGLLAIGAALSRLPVSFLLLRSMVVLPFSITFAAISWLSGDVERAVSLAAKSYLSAFAVLLLMGSTPLPFMLRGLESMYVPKLLLLIVQFLYRYLFVIAEQAARMRLAAQCRGGGTHRNRQSMFRRAAGALSVLFARSYGRAEGIHRAMLSRGFTGEHHVLRQASFRWRDGVFITVAAGATLIVRIGYAFIPSH